MKDQLKWVMFFIVSAAISGCSTPRQERTGGAIDVYPVTHKYALSVEPDRISAAENKVESFINQHRQQVLTNDIKLIYSTDLGLELVNAAADYLHSIGIAPSRLSVHPSKNNNQFDFELMLLDYQVQAPECDRSMVADYYLSDNGCFSENARWISMENPEKMLPAAPGSSSMQGRR
jgi:hypothetical protein